MKDYYFELKEIIFIKINIQNDSNQSMFLIKD